MGKDRTQRDTIDFMEHGNTHYCLAWLRCSGSSFQLITTFPSMVERSWPSAQMLNDTASTRVSERMFEEHATLDSP